MAVFSAKVGEYSQNLCLKGAECGIKAVKNGVSYLLTNLTGTSATLHRKPGPTCLSVGDEVMLINLMSRSNKHPNVGNYEFLRVGSVDVQKQTVYFTTAKTKSYGEDASKDTNIGFSAGQQVVALVRACPSSFGVPNYHNVTISGSITTNAFEAPTSAFGQGVGGVIVFRASGVLQGVGLIDARNLGYHGGAMGASGNCGESANGPTAGGCNGGGGAAVNANLTLQDQLYLGAGGGGNSTTVGARGGGIVYITGRTVKQRTGDANPPSIYVKGQNGGAAGAGAGGSIYLLGDTIDINSLLVSGGTSSTGNGDAGFSAVYYDLTFSGPTPGYLEDTSPATPTITKTPTLGPSPTVTRTPTVNGLPSTVSYAYNSSRPHAVTSLSNGNSYTYDDNGNTLTRTVDGVTTTFVYDGNNRVTSANNPSTNEVYWYDGDGTRVAKLVDNTTLSMYFAGGSYEVTGSSIRKYYSFGGTSIMDDGTGLKYFLSDQQGSTVAVTDSNGAAISQQRYLPFGQVRVDVGSITQTDFGYTGQRNMSSIGLMDYNARFYDQSLGRFIQPDTIVSQPTNPQTWNRYSYVENNPIRFTDPSGHEKKCAYNGSQLECKEVATDQIVDDSKGNKNCKTNGYGKEICNNEDSDEDFSIFDLVPIVSEIRQIQYGYQVETSAIADPDFMNQQQIIQHWYDNCYGQCHYANALGNPSGMMCGPMPSVPVVDKFSKGAANIMNGYIGIGSIVMNSVVAGPIIRMGPELKFNTSRFGIRLAPLGNAGEGVLSHQLPHFHLRIGPALGESYPNLGWGHRYPWDIGNLIKGIINLIKNP